MSYIDPEYIADYQEQMGEMGLEVSEQALEANGYGSGYDVVDDNESFNIPILDDPFDSAGGYYNSEYDMDQDGMTDDFF